jgi:hypothetical protein
MLLLLVEWGILELFSITSVQISVLFVISVIGSLTTIFVATEVIEEVRGAFRMILLLCAVVLEFVIFFAFQYFFLGTVQPGSFPTLLLNPSSLLLHSIMIFVFNPLYLPATSAGRILLLIQTFAALGLAFFVIQNIGEFRRKSLDRNFLRRKTG